MPDSQSAPWIPSTSTSRVKSASKTAVKQQPREQHSNSRRLRGILERRPLCHDVSVHIHDVVFRQRPHRPRRRVAVDRLLPRRPRSSSGGVVLHCRCVQHSYDLTCVLKGQPDRVGVPNPAVLIVRQPSEGLVVQRRPDTSTQQLVQASTQPQQVSTQPVQASI